MKLSETTLLMCDLSKMHMTRYSLVKSFSGPMIRCEVLCEVHEACICPVPTSPARPASTWHSSHTSSACRTLILFACAFPLLFPLSGTEDSSSRSQWQSNWEHPSWPLLTGWGWPPSACFPKRLSSPLSQLSPHCSVTVSPLGCEPLEGTNILFDLCSQAQCFTHRLSITELRCTWKEFR